MKLKQFEKIKDEIIQGRECIIRYSPLRNKKDWIDIISVITIPPGKMINIIAGKFYDFTFEYHDICGYHGIYNKDNIPTIRTIGVFEKEYIVIISDELISIRDGNLRTAKLKRIKENIFDEKS